MVERTAYLEFDKAAKPEEAKADEDVLGLAVSSSVGVTLGEDAMSYREISSCTVMY